MPQEIHRQEPLAHDLSKSLAAKLAIAQLREGKPVLVEQIRHHSSLFSATEQNFAYKAAEAWQLSAGDKEGFLGILEACGQDIRDIRAHRSSGYYLHVMAERVAYEALKVPVGLICEFMKAEEMDEVMVILLGIRDRIGEVKELLDSYPNPYDAPD